MKVRTELLTEKGHPVDTVDVDFPKAACMSDVAQQAPKVIISYNGEWFGFSSCGRDALCFRRKEIYLCA